MKLRLATSVDNAALALFTRTQLPVHMIVENDLFSDEAICPDATPAGRIRSGALVYRRTDVSPLRSMTGWSREGCQPREGEVPYGRRAANVGKLVEYDVWADWQVVPSPPWRASPRRLTRLKRMSR